MSKLHMWLYGGLIVLVLGLLYLSWGYSVRTAKAEGTQTAMEKANADRDKAMAQRDQDFKVLQANVEVLKAQLTAKSATQVLAPIIVPQGGNAPATVSKGELPPEVAKTLPGASNANFTLLSDEQMVKLGQRELTCQITEAGLSKCGQDKADMQAKIDALTKANLEWAKAGSVPRWTAGVGVAKSAGNGYTPVVLIDYRFQPKWGLGVFAENRAVGGMVTVHFGATPK